MADGSPPSKRQKKSDIFNLENELPEELLNDSALQTGITNGPITGKASNSNVQSQHPPPSSASGSNSIMPAPAPITSQPPVQPHNKQLTQLLQSGRNSPKYAGSTPSPGNAGTNSPHPPRQISQTSPASMPLQSPNAGNIVNNIKSPVNSAVAMSRPGGMRTTPSPRVQSSLAMSAANSPLVHTCLPGTGTFNRNLVTSQQTILANSSNPSLPNLVQQSQGITNGPVRSQMQVMSNMNVVQGMSSSLTNVGNIQGNLTRIQNPNTSGSKVSMAFSRQGNIRMQAPLNNDNATGNHFNVYNNNVMIRPQNQPVQLQGMMDSNPNRFEQSQHQQQQQQRQMVYTQNKSLSSQQFSGMQQIVATPSNQNSMMSGQPNVTNIGMPQVQQNSSSQILIQQRPMQNSNMQQSGLGMQQIGNQIMNRVPASAGAGSGAVDPEKRRLIQHQLFLLLHAHKCLKSETNGEPSSCAVPHCHTMKNVLQHMNACTEGKQCQIPHCASSRQIIAHWKQCKRDDCSVCFPLKNQPINSVMTSSGSTAPKSTLLNSATTPAAATNTNSNKPISTGNTATMPGMRLVDQGTGDSEKTIPLDKDKVQEVLGLNNMWKPDTLGNSQTPGNSIQAAQGNCSTTNMVQPKITHEWHSDVKEELRNYLVQKLVQSIFSTPEKISVADSRMVKLLQFARKVEGTMYEQANSREEYYHLLAEKIYKINKELEEKRQKKTLQTAQAQGPIPINGPGVYTATQQQPSQQYSFANKPPGSMNLPRMLNNPNQVPGAINSNINIQSQGSGVAMNGMASDTMHKFAMAQKEIKGNAPSMAIRPTMSSPNQVSNSAMNQQPMLNTLTSQNFVNQGQQGGYMVDHLSNQQGNMQFTNSTDLTSIQGAGNMQSLQQNSSLLQQQLQNDPNKQHGGAGDGYVQQSHPDASNSTLSGTMGMFSPDPLTQQMQAHQLNSKVVASAASSMQSATDTSILTGIASSTGMTSVKTEATPFPTAAASSASNDAAAFVHRKVSSDVGTALHGTTARKVKSETDDSMTSFRPKSPCQTSVALSKQVKMETSDENFPVAISTSNTAAIKVEPKIEAVMAPTKPKPQVTPKIPKPSKEFLASELRDMLMPVVNKLFEQEPDAEPFRYPVDADRLNIPDYYDIVKKPMDLSLIRKNLESGVYREPWEFVNDIWLMFSNAWLYNRKTSRVYKYCTRLKEVFELEIDPVMQELGYCCGRKLEFMPMTLCCYGKTLCTISTGAVYYEYQNSSPKYGLLSDRYDFCEKCFNEIQGDKVPLSDEPGQGSNTIPKNLFEKKKNDILDPEPFVQCDECGRRLHTICVLHNPQIWPEGFVCDSCHRSRGTQRKPNRFMASKLPHNKLSEHVEQRVNNYLKRHDTNNEAGYVHIRCVYSGEKAVEVKTGMKSKFVESKEIPESFPYKAKAFFAFEEHDGVDICFFGVHVQEYGSDAPQPNTRRVYLSYLDSVHFFRPRHLRTAVYHEILIGYFEYCKNLGYEFAHIWACPPSEGDDYVFHCHPVEQKIPKPKRLQDWYRKMLDKAIVDQVVLEYNDIFKQAKDDRLQSARELPYFEGDFWPNVLEESIKELEQEEEDRKQAEINEQAAADEAARHASLLKFTPLQSELTQGPANAKNGKTKQKSKKVNSKKASQRSAKKKLPQVANDLSDKLYQIMEKHKEVFFVIRLQAAETISKLGSIADPDPLMPCDLMDGRDSFLTLAREKHYEFSSLRRTKWSTMAMLVELHMQGQDKFVYTCNNCRNSVETRYHCSVCEDFDLCNQCYHQVGHDHKMDQMGLGLDVDPPGVAAGGNVSANRRRSVQRYINSLVHACQCKNANCSLPACIKMKKVVAHARNCKRKANGECPICKQVIALCLYHAKFCLEAKCQVPFCFTLKSKLKQQEKHHRRQQSLLMRRRMANMENMSNTVGQGGPNTPGAPATPVQPATPQEQPSTPITNHIMGPGTPGGPGTPNAGSSSGKRVGNIMMSPRAGKGMPQQPVNQQQQLRPVGPMNMLNHSGGMQHTSQVPMQQQQAQQHGQIGLVSPSQSAVRPAQHYQSPPARAVIAAKQAEQVARAQATTGVRPGMPGQPNSFQRAPTGPIAQRPGMINPGNMQWADQTQRTINNPNFVAQSGLSNPGRIINASSSTPQQMAGPIPTSSDKILNMVNKNPHLAAHVIKQTRQQQQLRQQNMVQGSGGSAGIMANTMSRGMQQNQINQSIPMTAMNQQQGPMTMQSMHQMQPTQQMNNIRQIRQFQQQQQFQPAPPYSQAIANQRIMSNAITTNPAMSQQMKLHQQQQLQRIQHGQRIQNANIGGQMIQSQMGQSGINIGQTPMMSQPGMTNQQGMIGQRMSNPQQMANPNLQGGIHQSVGQTRPPSQTRVPQMSPHSNISNNVRQTNLSGQLQMVNPSGAMMHGNMATGGIDQQFGQGAMMSGNFSRTMGNMSNQIHGMTYTNNSNQMAPTQGIMTTDSLEKFAPDNE